MYLENSKHLNLQEQLKKDKLPKFKIIILEEKYLKLPEQFQLPIT